MKCEKCGFIPNPGDQVCMNCGAKLSLLNAVVPEVEEVRVEEKKDNKKVIIFTVIGVLVLIVIIFLIVKFLILKWGFMKNKLLVIVYVPLIEKELDVYIPIVKKVGTVKNLIIKVVEESSEGTFVNDGCKNLYDKLTGNKIDDNQFVKESIIKNGSKLILY